MKVARAASVLEFPKDRMGTPDKNAKQRAPRNRTLSVGDDDAQRYRVLLRQNGAIDYAGRSRLFLGDAKRVLTELPPSSADLLFADPPYNLTKRFGGKEFKGTSIDAYEAWLEP